jgi:TPR repeat protein
MMAAAAGLLFLGAMAAYFRMSARGHPVSADCQGADACERACKDGDSCACGALGSRLLHGGSVARDSKRGLSLLETACSGGCPTACWTLGSAFQSGSGVRADTTRAKGYFDRVNAMCEDGCKSGDADRCFTLGGAYLSGHGVSADRGKAEKLYSQAADLYETQCNGGNPHACTRLALQTDHGLGLEESKAKAATLYVKACQAGDAESCEEAAKHYDGRLKDLPRDDARARELAHKACEAGRAGGCAIAEEPDAFMKIVEDGCSKGSSYDCGSGAFALANGSHGVTRDLARATPLAARMIELEQKACEDEDGSACAALARPYESGSAEGEPEGTVLQRDTARSASLRARACDLGYQSACKSAQHP